MRRWVAVLGFSVIACSPATNPVAGATASPISDLPLTKVGFSCRLPLSISTPSAAEDAFVSFPSGTVAIDPIGKGGLYFDRPFSRWLPVAGSAVSPDGAHYAFVVAGQPPDKYVVHVVDVATGKDHQFPEVQGTSSPAAASTAVVDYSTEGIYLSGGVFEGNIFPGLWRFDLPSGSVRRVSSISGLQMSAGGGAFWFGAQNPADPQPVRGIMSIWADQIGRLDVRSGRQVIWLYRPGTGLEVRGLDAGGRPLILAVHEALTSDTPAYPTAELMIALDSASQRSIYKGAIVATLSGAIADAHGVWFGSPQGIYLYSDRSGLQKVSNQPGYPANGCF